MLPPFVKFFKYIYLFVLQFLSFVTMSRQKLELMGIVMSIIIATVTHIFLIRDIFSSDKQYEMVIYVIIFSICLLFTSSIFIIKTLYHLHKQFSAKKSIIHLTKENRARLDKYKNMFITCIIFIGLLAFSFFTLKCTNCETIPKTYEKYYHEDVILNLFSADNTPVSEKILPTISGLIKMGMSISVLSISGYMVYLTHLLSKINANQLYIPESLPYDESEFSIGDKFSMGDIFKNINIHYLSNYTPVVNL
jgi:hypothetical protein